MADKPIRGAKAKASASGPRSSVSFLLTQIGTFAAGRFAERLQEISLAPPHAGILRMIAQNQGISQQALCQQLSILPSRLVVLLDELEKLGLVERRNVPEDRRSYALHLTDDGSTALASINTIATEHDREIVAPLSAAEKTILLELLGKLADSHGLAPGVHPGFSRIGGRRGKPGE